MLGGIMNKKAQKKANAANAAEAAAARKQAQDQFDAQMDQTIQRRVADAKQAGIHPLYALGASPGASPGPVIAGQHESGSGLGDGISAAGNAIATGIQNRHAQKLAELQLQEQQKNNAAARFRDRASAMRDLSAAMAAASATKTAQVNANHHRADPNDIPKPQIHDPGYKGSVKTPAGQFHQRNQRTPAGEVAERYGGVAEELFGLWYLTQDVGSLLGNELFDYTRAPKPTGADVDDYRLAP